MIKTFIQVAKNMFLPEQKIALGRWGTIYNNRLVNSRVDRSNEDHCGPCGLYAIEKKKELEKKK